MPFKPQATKKNVRQRALGIYYTPSGVADILAAWAIRTPSEKILEPSFGGCALLSSAIKRLHGLGAQNPDVHFFGYDIDPAAFVHLKNLFPNKNLDAHFFQRNFLEVTPGAEKVSAVIANPPFVSYHRMDKSQRDVVAKWRVNNHPSFSLTASLWAYFLIHAMSFLQPLGRMAFVLPSAAVSSDYAQHVLNKVFTNFEKIKIFRIEEQLFAESGTDERAVILLAEGYQSIKRNDPMYFSALNLVELEKSINQESKKIDHPENLNNAHLIFQKLRENKKVRVLGDLANITIGEVVGDTKFFVKTHEEWKALGIAAHYLKPLLTRTRQTAGMRITQKEIDSRSIPYLLHPKTDSASKIAKYLETYPKARIKTNATFAKRKKWYQASYEKAAAAFVGSLSHDFPKIILNTANISCANGLYKITAKTEGNWRPAFAAASLCTLFQWSAELYSRPMGAGAMKLEPSDVRRLIVPTSVEDLNSSESSKFLRTVDTLLRAGKNIEATELADKVLLLDPKIITGEELEILKNSLFTLRERRHKQKSMT
jgi:adenine-specific DNA-methyltransferase